MNVSAINNAAINIPQIASRTLLTLSRYDAEFLSVNKFLFIHLIYMAREYNPQLRVGRAMWASPQDLLQDFFDYLELIEENALKEAKIYGGEGQILQLDKMRAPSMQGFAFYLRTISGEIKRYGERGAEWEAVLTFIEEGLYAKSYEGAAAGLLKESIVMRKLGMADKVEQTNTQKRIVIMHTPDNGRARFVEDAEEEPQNLISKTS